MIASRSRQHAPLQRAFLAMLPAISRYAAMSFAHLRGDDFDNAVQEVLANCYVTYVRLARRGHAAKAFPATLARFAIAQVRDGRQVGTPLNARDVSSLYARQRKRFSLQRIDRFDHQDGHWTELVVEDRRTPVLEQVAFRIDFPDWLSRLSMRNRQIAQTLALGYSTQDASRRFAISAGRISQLRRELHLSWQRFHGESA